MTSTQKLASILKQFVSTNSPTELENELKALSDIHTAEAKELQTLRDDYQAICGSYEKIRASYVELQTAHAQLGARVDALEQRNTSDDTAVDEALKGFTGGETAASGEDAPAAAEEPEAPPPAETQTDPVAPAEAAE